jgi:hypothetical protein
MQQFLDHALSYSFANGFKTGAQISLLDKAVKTAYSHWRMVDTGLKPGVNESFVGEELSFGDHPHHPRDPRFNLL